MSRKKADFDQFQIRLPPGMRDQIKALAERNDRSMNAEIVYRLGETLLRQADLFDEFYDDKAPWPGLEHHDGRTDQELFEAIGKYNHNIADCVRVLSLRRRAEPKAE